MTAVTGDVLAITGPGRGSHDHNHERRAIMTFLLVGATGQVGSIVTRNLLGGGHRVRALVRDPDAAAAKLGPGVDYVRADLDDPATLPSALKGVDAAYLATAPSPAMAGQEGNFIDAATAAGLPRLVGLGVLGTDVSVPIFKYHQDIEAKIASSGIPATILRPGGFYSSFLFLAEVIRAGILPSAAGDGRHPWIDHGDVADVATAVLLDPGYDGQVLPMTGPKALTYDDAAAALQRALGRPVAHQRIDEEALRAQQASMGLPDWLTGSFLGQHRLMRENKLSTANTAVEDVLGRPPRTLDQWLAENRDAFGV
jgi:uncharacterized protein YbjT (DUF2867 family)